MASVVKTSIALADRKEGEEPARLEFQWPRGGRLGARSKTRRISDRGVPRTTAQARSSLSC